MNMGRMMRSRGMPAAFMAVNSNCSPMLPNVSNDVSKTDMGNAIGTRVSPM